MYGFLRTNCCQLDKEHRETYKKFYCGQCTALQKQFGYKWRSLLSYDATFFGLLIAAQQQEQVQEGKAWCAIFPKKMSVYTPDNVSQQLSTALAMLIFSSKLADSFQEKPSYLKAKVIEYCQPQFDKAKTILHSVHFPVSLLDDTFSQQQQIEALKGQTIETYAEPSARLFAEIFRFTATVTQTDENETALYDLGYHVGKVIYLMDSCIDLVAQHVIVVTTKNLSRKQL